MVLTDPQSAGRADLVIRQGVTFSWPIGWKPGGVLANMTGYTARMMVRSDYGIDPPLVDLTTANGHITLGDGTGTSNILVTMSAAETAILVDWGRGAYDLEIVSSLGEVRRVLEGYAYLSREATE